MVKMGSKPSEVNSASTEASTPLSIFAITTATGFSGAFFFRCSAISLSRGCRPSLPSTTNRILSASSMAKSTCFLTSVVMGSSAKLNPPVSMTIKWVSRYSQNPYILSLVIPGLSSTIASLLPVSLLNRVDLPTFGLPMIATALIL